MPRNRFVCVILVAVALSVDHLCAAERPLPKVRIAMDGRTFETEAGKPFVPFGVNYHPPGTGWAPQVWKQFDAEATRKDFARMKELGINCVRVFLSYGSFYTDPGVLVTVGLLQSSVPSLFWSGMGDTGFRRQARAG